MDDVGGFLLGNFYPRPPRGGRRKRRELEADTEQFLSTPSARRATGIVGLRFLVIRFLSTPSARRATLAIAWT